AFSVTARTRELGIRLALGARRTQLIWLVMREVLALIAIGTAFALPAAWTLSRTVRAELYGIAPGDATSTAVAATLLARIALLAGVGPARKASTISPTEALRSE